MAEQEPTAEELIREIQAGQPKFSRVVRAKLMDFMESGTSNKYNEQELGELVDDIERIVYGRD